MKRAMIAMSGGVDSSVAALFMKNNGYDCIGVTMKLYNKDDFNFDSKCCTEQDIDDAKRIAEKLNIPHYVYNFTDKFKEKVIDKFVSIYENGGTPNPCVECNRYLKFEKLIEIAKEDNFDYVVTGHYADIEFVNGRYLVKKAKDISKDQSYVLYSLTQEQLAHTLFPLGKYSKEDIRKIAGKYEFANANKRDSQDICFIPNGDYSSFIENYTGKKYPEGDFVDKNGNVLGKHKGIIRYTIGQRKGLDIALGHPAYVCSKNLANNTVVLGSNEDLFQTKLVAENFNWMIDKPDSSIKCFAKTRYNMTEQPCTVICNDDKVTVEFDEPVRAITSGQAVVLYKDNYVLGGGTII